MAASGHHYHKRSRIDCKATILRVKPLFPCNRKWMFDSSDKDAILHRPVIFFRHCSCTRQCFTYFEVQYTDSVTYRSMLVVSLDRYFIQTDGSKFHSSITMTKRLLPLALVRRMITKQSMFACLLFPPACLSLHPTSQSIAASPA